MGMLELVVRSRLGRDGLIHTSSSLFTHSVLLLFFVFSSSIQKEKQNFIDK